MLTPWLKTCDQKSVLLVYGHRGSGKTFTVNSALEKSKWEPVTYSTHLVSVKDVILVLDDPDPPLPNLNNIHLPIIIIMSKYMDFIKDYPNKCITVYSFPKVTREQAYTFFIKWVKKRNSPQYKRIFDIVLPPVKDTSTQNPEINLHELKTLSEGLSVYINKIKRLNIPSDINNFLITHSKVDKRYDRDLDIFNEFTGNELVEWIKTDTYHNTTTLFDNYLYQVPNEPNRDLSEYMSTGDLVNVDSFNELQTEISIYVGTMRVMHNITLPFHYGESSRYKSKKPVRDYREMILENKIKVLNSIQLRKPDKERKYKEIKATSHVLQLNNIIEEFKLYTLKEIEDYFTGVKMGQFTKYYIECYLKEKSNDFKKSRIKNILDIESKFSDDIIYM